jgi:N-acetyl sugar amidotransferase
MKNKIKSSTSYTVSKNINSNFAYIQCNRCVMDNINNSEICFDEIGNCNYCNDYTVQTQNEENNSLNKSGKLKRLIKEVKETSKKYDCVVGVSGGVDSAYLIYKLVELGVKPIAVHFDNGWNSGTATQNINSLLNELNVDLYTYVCDWEEFKDLQLSFIKAGVTDIELVTDHGISATLFNAAKKFNTKYIFQGHNQNSEFIMPNPWMHWKNDALNIKSIHKKYGKHKLKSFPFLTFFTEYYHLKIRKTQYIYFLDFIEYNKKEAEKILKEKFGWKSYGAKHNESIFTRFYQNYILPVKFNVDKRKAHLSSLICSGQISREEALEELKIKCWETKETLEDKNYVLKKLGVSEDIFDNWMQENPVSHLDFPSYLTRHNEIILSVKKYLGKK